MEIHLRDRSLEMVKAWEMAFKGAKNVYLTHGNIFDDGTHMNSEAIVSPANSFGFMDGGIDGVYSTFFGWKMSERLRSQIRLHHDGELLVGNYEVVEIFQDKSDASIPYLISVPTMRTPQNVSHTVNAYLAFRAALRAAKKFNFHSILSPGMATAIGQMPFEQAAIQMRQAYNEITSGEKPIFDTLTQAHIRHHMMLNPNTWRAHQFPSESSL